MNKGLLHFHLSKFCQINKHPSSGNNLYNSQLRHRVWLKPTTPAAAERTNCTKTKLPQSTPYLQLQWLSTCFQFLPTRALPTCVDTHIKGRGTCRNNVLDRAEKRCKANPQLRFDRAYPNQIHFPSSPCRAHRPKLIPTSRNPRNEPVSPLCSREYTGLILLRELQDHRKQPHAGTVSNPATRGEHNSSHGVFCYSLGFYKWNTRSPDKEHAIHN